MPEAEAIFDDHGLKWSCTVVIGETVMFFGGEYQERQISQLTPLGLIRIGTVPFSFRIGLCLVMESQIFLGFSHMQTKSCWSR